MSRYSNIEFVLNLGIESGIALIKEAFKKQREERLWEFWTATYVWTDPKGRKSWEEFYAEMTTKVKSKGKTDQELEAWADKVMAADLAGMALA